MKRKLIRLVAIILSVSLLYIPASQIQAVEEEENEEVLQEENQEEAIDTNEETEEIEESQEEPSLPQVKTWLDRNLLYETDIHELSEIKISLIMINNQIEYLGKQIKEKDAAALEIARTYEKMMENMKEEIESSMLKEIELLEGSIEEKNERIEALEKSLATAEDKAEKYREEASTLHNRFATFAGETGLYLFVVLGFFGGLVVGSIITSIKKRSGKKKDKEASA